jgi:hypothetical protein
MIDMKSTHLPFKIFHYLNEDTRNRSVYLEVAKIRLLPNTCTFLRLHIEQE